MSAVLDTVMDNAVINVLSGRIAMVACRWCREHTRAVVATTDNPITLRRLFVAARHDCKGDSMIRRQLLAMLDGGPDRPQRPLGRDWQWGGV